MKQRYQLLSIVMLFAMGTENLTAGCLKQAWSKTTSFLRFTAQSRRNFLKRTEDRRGDLASGVFKAGITSSVIGIGLMGFETVLEETDKNHRVCSRHTKELLSTFGMTLGFGGFATAALVPLPFLAPFGTAAVATYAGLLGGTSMYAQRKNKSNEKQATHRNNSNNASKSY